MNNLTHEDTEELKGYVSPDFVEDRKNFYMEIGDKTYVIGCGDEREPTDASAYALAAAFPEALDVREGYASIYGGSIGIAKNVVVAGVAQYGPSFVTTIGGIIGAHQKLVSYLQKDNKLAVPSLHSAANNEGREAEFDPDSQNVLGCKYAISVGATAALLVGEDRLIRDTARQDQKVVFGNDDYFDPLITGQRVVLEDATNGKGSEFGLTRSDYASSGLPVMILVGKPHVSAKASGVISSFDMTKVRSSTAANAAKKDFYNEDIAVVTNAALEIFREYDLDPEILMRAFLLDATPVRAVLASEDKDPDLHGKLDPRNLPIGVYGDPQAALAELRQHYAA